MIRAYCESDLESVTEMVAKDRPSISHGLIATRMARHGIVYEVNGKVQGVAAHTSQRETPAGSRVNAWVYIDPAFRCRGVGGLLWRELMSRMETVPQLLATSYRVDKGDPTDFFTQRGFAYWLAGHCLGYRGTRIKYTPTLTVEHYTDDLFWDFVNLTNEGFLSLRQEHNILPHLCYPPGFNENELRERRLDSQPENIYFFRDSVGSVVGYTFLEGPAIDTIVVAQSHMRKGYGREMMSYSINTILDRGYKLVTLEVADTNTGARRLYSSLGFELMETVHDARIRR